MTPRALIAALTPAVLTYAAIAFAYESMYPNFDPDAFYKDQSTACKFEGASFECPALTPYDATYIVRVDGSDHEYTTRRVDVATAECEVTPEEVVLRLELTGF